MCDDTQLLDYYAAMRSDQPTIEAINVCTIRYSNVTYSNIRNSNIWNGTTRVIFIVTLTVEFTRLVVRQLEYS